MFPQDRIVRFAYFSVDELEVLCEDKLENGEGTVKGIIGVVDAMMVV